MAGDLRHMVSHTSAIAFLTPQHFPVLNS